MVSIIINGRILNVFNDNDLYKTIIPLNIEKEKGYSDVLATFSHNEKKEGIIDDMRQVVKSQQINQIRKSEGYMKFINKFKK